MSGVKLTILIFAVAMAAILSIGAGLKDYFIGDVFLARAIQRVTATPWEDTMQVVSFIGQSPILIAIASPVFAWALWKTQKAEICAVLVALLSFGFTPAVKILVGRPRPADDLIIASRVNELTSFPSGHVFNSVVLFGLLFYLAPLLLPWKPAVHAVRVASILLIVLMGISRIYVGAHWPSDTLGGFLFGAIILTLLIRFHRMLIGTDEPDERRDVEIPVETATPRRVRTRKTAWESGQSRSMG